MDLSEFLLARIAEDEEVARATSQHPVPADADAVRVVWYRHDTGWVPSAKGEWAEGQVLFERFDPARVLAGCESKRRIVEECMGMYDRDAHLEDRGPDLADWVLQYLALPYADHEQFQEEWRV